MDLVSFQLSIIKTKVAMIILVHMYLSTRDLISVVYSPKSGTLGRIACACTFLTEVVNHIYGSLPMIYKNALAQIPISTSNRCYYTFMLGTVMGIFMVILISISLPIRGS